MTREEFHQLADKRYDRLQALNKLDNFYDYEKQFVSIWQELGKAVLENNLGSLSKDKRKKKPYNNGSCDNEQRPSVQ
jgi:hypothetical protein